MQWSWYVFPRSRWERCVYVRHRVEEHHCGWLLFGLCGWGLRISVFLHMFMWSERPVFRRGKRRRTVHVSSWMGGDLLYYSLSNLHPETTGWDDNNTCMWRIGEWSVFTNKWNMFMLQRNVCGRQWKLPTESQMLLCSRLLCKCEIVSMHM
eukprot:PhF_6_TR7873/c0_g1_i3/m.11528